MDGRGVPTAVVIAAANVPDFLLLGDTLSAQQVEPIPEPAAPSRVVCLDRGYRQKAVVELCQTFDVSPAVEARKEEAHRLAGHHAPHAKRWIIDRTIS